MSLFDQLSADLTSIAADTSGPAIEATYTPKAGGPGVALKLVFERGAAMERDASDGKTMVGEAIAHIPVARVPVVRLFDVLTVQAVGTPDLEQWGVERILEQNAALTVVNLQFIKRTRLVTQTEERKR